MQRGSGIERFSDVDSELRAVEFRRDTIDY
jgi:hypothetical protein